MPLDELPVLLAITLPTMVVYGPDVTPGHAPSCRKHSRRCVPAAMLTSARAPEIPPVTSQPIAMHWAALRLIPYLPKLATLQLRTVLCVTMRMPVELATDPQSIDRCSTW